MRSGSHTQQQPAHGQAYSGRLLVDVNFLEGGESGITLDEDLMSGRDSRDAPSGQVRTQQGDEVRALLASSRNFLHLCMCEAWHRVFQQSTCVLSPGCLALGCLGCGVGGLQQGFGVLVFGCWGLGCILGDPLRLAGRLCRVFEVSHRRCFVPVDLVSSSSASDWFPGPGGLQSWKSRKVWTVGTKMRIHEIHAKYIDIAGNKG